MLKLLNTVLSSRAPKADPTDLVTYLTRTLQPFVKDIGDRWNEFAQAVNGGTVEAGGASLRVGSGVPAASLGANGDFYFRTDGTAGAAVYQRRSGAWVAVA